MEYVLKDYQKQIVDKIVNVEKVGIFVGMGLGKTLSTLHAIHELMYNRGVVNRVLIVAPARVAKTVWTDEIKKWDFPFSVISLDTKLYTRERDIEKDADIYIISRDKLGWLAQYLRTIRNWKWDMVVCDESSSFKNHTAKRFKVLAKASPAIQRMVLLTGTPAPRSYMNLWSQVFLLDQGRRLEPTITSFRWKYFTPDKMKGHIVYSYKLRKGADKDIQERVHDICFGLESSITIKEPIINLVEIELPDKIKHQINQFKKDLVTEIEGSDIVALTASTLSTKLLQMASGAVYNEDKGWTHIHDEKLKALEEIIDSEDGNNILVMYNYKHEAERIKKYFKQAEDLDVKKWNEGKQPLALAHPASCGHGLNLQAGGHIMVWFSPTFDLELYQQANARLNRTGQQYPVTIHHIVCKGTRDMEAIKALKDKDYSQNDFIKSVLMEINKPVE